jgi:hypothetical protein
MNSFLQGSRVITAVAVITFALLGTTACQQDGIFSSNTASSFDNANAIAATNTASGLSLASLADSEDDALAQAAAIGNISEQANHAPRILEMLGVSRDSASGVRPAAILEISRRRLSETSTQTGGAASARFNGSLGVKGVSVSVLGASYQFVTPPMRQRNGGNPPNGNPVGTTATRIAETIFVYPAPPSTSATTALPSLITLTDANATATFTINGYTLADNTLGIPGKITLTNAKDGDVLPRSAAFTMRWSVAGTFTNGVVTIHNVLDSAARAGKSRSQVEQLQRNLPKPIVKQVSAGAISVDFTAAELTSLQAGAAEISLGIVNTKKTNNDTAILMAHSRTGARLRLQ